MSLAHRYRRPRLLTSRWSQQEKSNMAEQEGKKTIDYITKSTIFAILPSLCFETHPIKFYGKEKHNAKILSIHLSEFDEKLQNYSSIKVYVKWSLGEFECFIA